MTRVDELRDLAQRIVDWLRPGCEQIEIVGALRRGAPTVSDIDILCQPATEPVIDLFGEHGKLIAPRFDNRRDVLCHTVNLLPVKGDTRLYQYISPELDASIDLFVCLPPARYGALQAIRTGPADFARLCVTSRLQGGAMPPDMRQQDGALWRAGAIVETPDESDWFREIGLPCWPPGRRSAEGLRMYLDREVVHSR